MSSLVATSAKETHGSLGWFQHEWTIILNVLHLSLLIYYYIYEAFAWLFAVLHYPQLPTIVYFNTKPGKGNFGSLSIYAWGGMAIAGAAAGLLGSASMKLSLILLSCLMCSPFVAYDLYLLVLGRFHLIDVDNFLLFQTLFTTTFRFFRILAVTMNVVMLLHFLSRLPDGLSFGDFL